MNIAFSPEVLSWHYINEGVKMMNARNFKEAISYLDESLKLEPYSPHAHWNKAVCLLSLGEYEQGFAELEWRWQLFDHCWGLLDKDIERVLTLPRWQGEKKQHLLLYHEQGFGDAIMMMRFLPELKKRAEVTLLTVKPLLRLCQEFDIECIVTLPKSLKKFDCRCALFDPVSIFNYRVENIPNAPYIKVDWRRDPKKLGIVWSGNTQKIFTVESFLANLDTGGYVVTALQPGAVPPEVTVLPPGDFRDTANVMATCGAIVCVDTSAANLAGAIGHPNTHVLQPYLPDWRWYNAKAWYPTLKHHQAQRPGHYSQVFADINRALQ